ncbi:MAG: type II toxin-antitoxin system RelE/ParE family toxin [Bdellovibrionota bacterium]
MQKTWSIVYTKSAVKDLQSLPKNIAKNVLSKIVRCSEDPAVYSEPLKYTLKGYRKIKLASYRIVIELVLKDNELIVIAVKHRKEIYEELK